jgi:N-acetylmuramoyl-L-alanine amidase
MRLYKVLFFTFLTIFIIGPNQALLYSQSRKFTVIIDPGHGGRDPGAIGASSKEKDIVLSVGRKLGKLIEQNHPDVNVLYTRKSDTFVELNKRAEVANKAHGDIFISLHCNALDRRRTSPQGVETFVLGLHRSKDNLEVAKSENAVIMYEKDHSVKYEGFNPNEPESYIIFEFMANEFLDQSVKFASLVQNQLVRDSKRVNRNVRQAGFLVLREVAMPSVLVELGYISNRTEEGYLKSEKGQNSLAQSIYKAFSQYKRDYDKRSYVFNAAQDTKRDVEVPLNIASDDVEYRIQILVSTRKLNEKSREFKGLSPVSYYMDNGVYKYTYGSSKNINDISAILKEVQRTFKDAFIVELKNGKRIK